MKARLEFGIVDPEVMKAMGQEHQIRKSGPEESLLDLVTLWT